jgi:hypothetical protein
VNPMNRTMGIVAILAFLVGVLINAARADDPVCPPCPPCPTAPPPACPAAAPPPSLEQTQAVQRALDAIQAVQGIEDLPLGTGPGFGIEDDSLPTEAPPQ